MRVGIPTEIKNNEYRVAITPAGVKDLVSAGHDVMVQSGAGLGSGITDDAYKAQGAVIEKDAAKVWAAAAIDAAAKEELKLAAEDQWIIDLSKANEVKIAVDLIRRKKQLQ